MVPENSPMNPFLRREEVYEQYVFTSALNHRTVLPFMKKWTMKQTFSFIFMSLINCVIRFPVLHSKLPFKQHSSENILQFTSLFVDYIKCLKVSENIAQVDAFLWPLSDVPFRKPRPCKAGKRSVGLFFQQAPWDEGMEPGNHSWTLQ